MKILFQSRKTLFTVPGGDTIQVLKTADALRTKGCLVDISTELEPNVSGYHIVHLFNYTRPQDLYIQARNARRYNKKIVLSPIYVDYSESDRKGREGIQRFISQALPSHYVEYFKAIARVVTNGEISKGTVSLVISGFRSLQLEIANLVDIFLPNSESEMKRIVMNYPSLARKKFVVVPNAVDDKLFNANTTSVLPEVDKYKNCILCVARIETRKCQLNILRAVKDLPWPLVFIGKPGPNQNRYYAKIRKEANANVYFLGQIDHALLPQFYKVAKVHALVSWMETTGLSSLEAGIMGCNLVITDKGDTRDYFQNFAYYCDPDDTQSIGSAIIHAYKAPRSPDLKKRIAENYTWDKTAEATLRGYQMLL